MTAEEVLRQVKELGSKERERFYEMVMEGFFDTMMSDRGFMEKSFHTMAGFMKRMELEGLDMGPILSKISEEARMQKAGK